MIGINPVLPAAVLLPLIYYLYTALRWRRFKQYSALVQPKPSLMFGNLITMHEQTASGGMVGDTNRHPDMVLGEIGEKLGNPPCFFMDFRPVGQPMLIVASHEIAEQMSRATRTFPHGLPKSPETADLTDLDGFHSILFANGEVWKSLRKRFNPGFAPQHLMTLLPSILDKTQLFMNSMDYLATAGQDFQMDSYCTALTFDIIGAVVMDIDFRAQEGEEHQSEILTLFGALAATYTTSQASNLLPVWLQPRLFIRRKLLAHRINGKLRQLVHQKFSEQRQEAGKHRSRHRSVLSLSLQDLEHLDSAVVDQTVDQLKTFLFAGHDTTSILLQWAFYELSRTPRALKAVRAELDEIFGSTTTDPAVIFNVLLSQGDDLLQKMAYTSAVIKETLRLHPPAGGARRVPAGSRFSLKLPGGDEVCVDGMSAYLCSTLIQRDEQVYGETANVFVPERWLGESTNHFSGSTYGGDMGMDDDGGADAKRGKSAIPAGAWRPFERGPRSCIGQGLANIEARVVLAAAVKRYDFIKVGLGEALLDEEGQPRVDGNGQYKTASMLYNTMQVTAKPIDGCVMRVKLRSTVSDE